MPAVINLTVDADKLVSRAKSVSETVSRMRKDFENLNNAMTGTKRYWQGRAGDSHRKLYSDQIREIQEILSDMQKYPEDILKMADLYKKYETKNIQTASKLKSNIVH